MRRQISLYGVALTALLLATAPAGAASINLGGDGGLLDLGGSSDSGSDVSVDVGVGSGSSTGVDADLDADVGIGGDGDADLLFGNSNLVSTGGDNLVTVDTDDDADALVTLFGSSGGGTGAGVDLGGAAGDEVAVSLFGSGSTGGVGVAPPGSNDSATISLFGPANGGSGGGGGGAPPVGGNGIDSTQTGSVFGGSDGAGSGDGVFSHGIAPRSATRIAANANVQARGACFAPDDQQIAHLLGRGSYDGSATASWQAASSISIVPIDLCPDAKARLAAVLAADANMGNLQAAVAANARLNASLDPSYDPEDVLAVDQAGDELTVYVY